jgi:hypothetical protein
MKPSDILLDANFDLLSENGDFVVGDATRQHQELILLIEVGALREFPTTCVGLQSWLLKEDTGDLHATIKREFERDKMKVERVSVGSGGVISIEGVY